MPSSRRLVIVLLAATVGTVLADSAIVTLALPDILRELDASVGQVAWVLIAFNLVLAVFVVPAARLGERRDPSRACAGGIAVFALASAACAIAPTIEVLIAARAVQAIGGAVALLGCLELLVAVTDTQRGLRIWTAAGVFGTAAGPVVGGLLTEAISWQSIFIVQVPVALAAVPAALAVRARPVATRPRQRPALAPNLALVLLSAALAAALFLLVLLLVEGWRRSPATAALTVSVVPLAAFAAPALARLGRAGGRSEPIAGAILIAGGLAGLALPPSAHLAWTIAPQVLVGLGLGFTVDALTAAALRDRQPRTLHGGWTLSARHAGVVLGLIVLTPVFTADLRAAEAPAQEAIAALVLDAPLPPEDKITLAQELGERLRAERGRVPDLQPAFDAISPPQRAPGTAARTTAALATSLDTELERAATRAFRDSFLIAAGFALAALVPLATPARRRPAPEPVRR